MIRLEEISKRIRRYWQDSRGVCAWRQQFEAMTRWYGSPFGRRQRQLEQEALNGLLPELFGFHLAQLSCIEGGLDTGSSRINHRFALAPEGVSEPHSVAEAAFEFLPLASDSVDVTLLFHTLECSRNPHQLLREAARITIPHGYLIIFCHNPLSLGGLRKEWGRWFLGRSHDRFHRVSAGRIKDWLKLLDFTPVYCQRLNYFPPVQHSGFLDKFKNWAAFCNKMQFPGGAVNLILARKELGAGTPLPAPWEAVTKPVIFPVAKPASFGHNQAPARENGS